MLELSVPGVADLAVLHLSGLNPSQTVPLDLHAALLPAGVHDLVARLRDGGGEVLCDRRALLRRRLPRICRFERHHLYCGGAPVREGRFLVDSRILMGTSRGPQGLARPEILRSGLPA